MTRKGDWPAYSKLPLFGVWKNMLARCYCPSAKRFERYGGRGIVVCDEWRNSARAFIGWAFANGWERGLQLDRRDNGGPYAPDNCRFVTPKANANNRGNNVRLASGEALSLAAARNGMRADVVRNRVLAGWSPEAAVTVPINARIPALLMPDGRRARQVAIANGVSGSTFDSRIRYGWSVEDAATLPVARVVRKNSLRMPDGRVACEVARANGVSTNLMHGRVLQGWPLEDAVAVPPGGKRPSRQT